MSIRTFFRYILEKFLLSSPISENDTKTLFRNQRNQIENKPLLKNHYENWYQHFINDISNTPKSKGIILELGSGGGYLKEKLPNLVTSDISLGVSDLVLDGRELPFGENSIRGMFLSSVFHHIPDVNKFLSEVQRTLCPGGVLVLIEPANTPVSLPYYKYLHHEDFNPKQKDWNYIQDNALLDANGTLSWIVFVRDRNKFQKEYPDLVIEKIEYLDWISYILSGGVNYRSPFPRSFSWIGTTLDKIFRPFNRWCTIVWYLRIRKSA